MYKKCLLFSLFLLMAAGGKHLFASGIQVSGTTVTTNDDKTSAQVKFSLEWDHSWRLETSANSPSNWDAAWVFIKYRTLPGDDWNHAYISTTEADHKMPGNASFSLGNAIAVVGGVNTTVNVGAFIYRKETGNGTIAFQDIELNWDFGKNGLTGGEQVEVCVLATEMVYIPSTAFWVGDYTSAGRFTRNQSRAAAAYGGDVPFQIAAANPTHTGYFSNYWNIRGTTNTTYDALRNGLYNNCISSMSTPLMPTPDDISYGTTTRVSNASNLSTWTNYASAINTGFPKGFSAFYCMKYEITQGEYVQFLNKNTVAVKNAGTYFQGSVATAGRYAISKVNGTGTADVPAVYELSTATAAYLPCNYLNTNDITAWLIWAGLRPMTELEFEKACRGSEAIPSTAALRPQYAWGTVNITNASGFSNHGGANEAPSNNANCNVAKNVGTTTTIAGGTNTDTNGPMRAGGFATAVSSREKAGATYYGIMEMSGNLWERCITVGHANGRAFTGAHGNGEIGVGTTPDLPLLNTSGTTGGWPAVNAAGLGFRGGSYLDTQDRARISDRYFINVVGTTRSPAFGGRGVRTAP